MKWFCTMLKIGVYIILIYTLIMAMIEANARDLFLSIMYGLLNQVAWLYKPALFKQLDKDFK